LHRFANDILGELAQAYLPIHRYHTKQRILIPLHDSDRENELPSSREAPSDN